MASIFNPMFYLAGTSANDSWPMNQAGTYNYFLDGAGGVDTLSVGTLSLSQFTLKQNTDGTINLDTVSGASGSSASHFTLYNVETISYYVNSNARGQIDLRTYFPNVIDTSANVSTNLDLLQRNINTIKSINLVSPLTVSTTPDWNYQGVLDYAGSTPTGLIAPLTVSATQVSTDAGILAEIVGNYNLSISDSSANIATNLNALESHYTHISSLTQTDTGGVLKISATQLVNDAHALALLNGSTYKLAITDTSTNIASNLNALQANVAKITSVSQSDAGKTIAITAVQSSADHAALAKIAGIYNLAVTGTAGTDSLYDTTNSHATFIGGKGIDTFNVTGMDTITDLGNGGADILKIAASGLVNATLAGNWIATSATSNAGATAASEIINTNGFNVNVGAATGHDGWKLIATGSGTTSITGSVNNDIINGNTTGGLTINGSGGTDTITLGAHKVADTVYLVNNALETITGFGSSTGSIADVLNVTAKGNALAGLTLTNETTLATNNSPLAANSSGLVFAHADSGVALTAKTAAALFSDTQALHEFAIAKGNGIELLIETGVTTTSNVVWEIKDTAGVFTAIELTGVSVVAGHNLGFVNFH